jgi:hypothetical protein
MKSVFVAAVVVALAFLAAEAALAVPVPQWAPKNFRVSDSSATPHGSWYQFERRDGRTLFDWYASYVKGTSKKCRAAGADSRIRVPKWAKIYPLVGGPIPSLFRGRTIYYQDSSGVNARGIYLIHRRAWACTSSKRGTLVEVFTDYNDLSRMAMARMIWSLADS